MAGRVIDHRGEPTPATSLNRFALVSNCILNTILISTDKCVIPCQRNSLLSKQSPLQECTIDKNAENNCQWVAQPQIMYLQHSPYTSSGNIMEEG